MISVFEGKRYLKPFTYNDTDTSKIAGSTEYRCGMATEAMEILHMVTHNATYEIAENRTIASEQFYRLGLPDDIVQAIPLTEIINSPVSAGPDQGGFNILDMIQHIVGFLVQGESRRLWISESC